MKRTCGHHGYVNGCLSCFEFLCDMLDRFKELRKAVESAVNDSIWDNDEHRPLEDV